jgi:hypothetical protein
MDGPIQPEIKVLDQVLRFVGCTSGCDEAKQFRAGFEKYSSQAGRGGAVLRSVQDTRFQYRDDRLRMAEG